MADGLAITPTDGKNPTPQLPGTIDINPPKTQPGNTAAAAPNIPQANPPNVGGGPASFSDVTQSIADLVKAKTSELSASKDAFLANTNVDTATAQQLSTLASDSMSALANIQKAQKLPGGAQGDLAQIIGLFNSDYNPEYQNTRIKINEAKASQLSSTAAALKEQNNALPAILGKVSEAQQVIFNAQKDANTLALEGVRVNNEVMKTKVEAARLRIEMSQEARAAAEFRIKSMTTDQLQAALPLAQAGKGPLAGAGGLIEERLINEKQAITNLGIANNNLAKGNRQEYNDNLTDFVSHLPHDVVANQIAQAQKSGSPMVMFPTGTKGPDGKEQILQIPFNLAQTGLVNSMAVEKQANESLAADYSQRLNVIPNMQNIMTSANAFAGMDPRATQITTNMENVIKHLDPKDPASVRQVGLLLQDYQKQMEGIAKDNAGKFSTKEAQSSVETYGKTGKFDPQGGTAVMADSGGVPALTRASRYGNMWQEYNRQIAQTIVEQHLVPGAGIGAVNGSADAASIIAQMMAKPQGRESISKIGANILADPNKVKPLADKMKATIQDQSIKGVLTQLSSQKGASQLWGNILNHPETIRDQSGKVSASLLFEQMEKATVTARAQGQQTADYANTFLTALRNSAASSDDNSASDPNYSIQDHAAEAAIFGGNPVGSVLGDLHYNLRVLSQKAKKEMDARIQQDLSGQTQRDAIANMNIAPEWADALTGPVGIATDWAQKKIYAKTGQDVGQVPSATGTGLTVNQIKAIYGGGK